MSRLHTVRRLRELEERRALGAAAGAERSLSAARQVAADRVDALRTLTPPARPLDVMELRVLQLQGLAGHDLVLDAQADVDLAQDRHAELVRAWSMASVRRKSVERLEESRAAEAAVEARRASDQAMDETVLLRWRSP